MIAHDLTLIELADCIAATAHTGQQSSDSESYIAHPRYVAALVKAWDGDEIAQAIALLHDVLEDSDLTVDDLLDFGIPDDVCAGVVALTRHRDERGQPEPYLDRFIRRVVSAGARTRLVKRADLTHHLERRSTLKASLQTRYEKALQYLNENNDVEA